MLRIVGAVRWRRIAAVLLATPALALLAAFSAVWANHIVASGVPLGVHTMVPLAALVPLPVLAAAAGVGLVAAMALLIGTRQSSRPRAVGGTRAVALLSAAQAVVFAAQVLAVDQLHGVPDPGLVLVAAAVIQCLVAAVLTATLLTIAVGLPAAPALSTPWLGLPTRTFTPAPAPVLASSDAYRIGPRRGPPRPLFSD